MTKVFKNILISICGMFAFLFAGFFFVGCSVDYSKISLVPDKQSIELEVGESVDLTFTIENYQSGFSNKIQVNPRADGQTAVFSVSEPVYVNNNEIKVTVTGVAGGHGGLSVSTLEAGKECVVDVYVEQWSSSMEFDNSVLYVSNKTDFVPNSDLFIFDSNTTHKGLTYYYLQPKSDINFNTYTLTNLDLEEGLASFFDGVNYAEATIQQFDKVSLVKNETNSLILSLNGVESEIDLQSEFLFMAVYDHSVGNEDYENIVYDVASVYVLPDINATITGGYMDINTGAVDFQPLASDEIVIVPNNTHMVQYVLKIEMDNSIADSPLKMTKTQSNNYVDIDFFDYEAEDDEGKTVYYLKISQNSQTQATTNLSFDIFYDIAQGIDDESVNVSKDYTVDIQIAPTGLTVNGTSEPDRLILYNYYRYPEFGWNELLIDVISGYSSSPNYEGVYFTYDSTYLDIIYNNMTVNSGDGRLYTDLNTPFYIRGKLGINQISNLVVTVHLKSNILQEGEELTIDINCSIIAGATSVLVDENYSSNYFYLDYDGGSKNFDLQVYADHAFQYTTYTFLSGVDVLEIDTNDENPYTEVGDRFYLNLTLTPRLAGIGVYRVYLDNGMPIDLTFNVIKTLSSDTTNIQLTNEGNEAVTEAYYSVEDNADFDNALNIEILNPSTKTGVTFGNVAQFTITANVNSDGIKYVPNESGFVSVSKVNNTYRISTLDNGMTKITFTLTGLEVEDFRTKSKEIKLYVNVSSYSLVDEFYMKNGDNYALNNVVYYVTGGVSGSLQEEDETATLAPVANYANSMNFYQYFFDEKAFVDIFEDAEESNGDYIYTINNDQIYTEMVYEKYSRKFIYFYAQVIYSSNGNNSYTTAPTVTEVNVTKTYVLDGQTKSETKTIMLILTNGLMFLSSDFEYVDRNEIGDVVATYTVEFSNIYSIDTYGTFDMDSFTYRNNMQAVYNLSLSANLRQRNSTKKYDCQIETRLYQSIESISLATSLTELNFSNNTLNYSIGVYTYPTTSTNKNVRVEFVRTNGNPYVNMVTWDVDTSESASGVYTINLSCEDFFNENKDNIVNIEDYLTGRIYIYPAEWGDSYTSITENLQPIVIDVQYRNGSRVNPYLLETAEDVIGINANETTLKSHYEISTVIDMSTVKNFTPIGILNVDGQNVLYGFSGSIIGSNSQAAITNIVVSENNFSATVRKETISGSVDILYTGLIAQLNAPYRVDADDPNSDLVTPMIENVSFSGEFDLKVSSRAYVGLLSAVNKGEMINVGVRVGESSINMTQSQRVLYFGAVAGVNYGSIIQDFTKYDGTGYNYKVYSDKTIYTDENGNNYIIDDANNKIFVDKDKYAIDENGNRIKYDDEGNILLSSRDYTGQNSKNLAYYEGFVNIATASTNVYAGGIAGASSGVIKKISSSSLKLYGYAAYSAYTMISVTGTKNYNDYDKIYVGGAVGVATYNTGTTSLNEILLDNDMPMTGNTISNLLVGGEIDTSETVNYIDVVGGIVGYADTLKVATIDVLNNTSRVFLRANEYVGGIVGYDTYAVDYSVYTNFGTGNVIEAVDDGRNNFYASSLIKFKRLDNLPEDTELSKTTFYAVGNSTRNSRSYATYSFKAYSYLKRDYTEVESSDVVVDNSVSVANYYGDYIILNVASDGIHITQSYRFEFKEVDLALDESEYAMTPSGGATADVGVYFMYYFSVQGKLNEEGNASAQDEIEDLNFINPNSNFYPFSLGSQDVNITSSNSNILSVDVNGNLTVKGTGLATITLTSILNVVQSRIIYIYIVNYFDKDVSSSIFYTSGNINGVNITDGSNLNIYGNSNTNVHVVPTYSLNDGVTYNGDKFTITTGGVLTYENVSYNLSKNTQIEVPSAQKTEEYVQTSDTEIVDGKEYFTYDAESDTYVLVTNPDVSDIGSYYEQPYFSSVQINKQTIVFFKDKSKTANEGDVDTYSLTPMLRIVVQIGTEKYEFYYALDKSTINLNVTYKESATSIRTNSKYHSMQTNNTFKDTVTVVSTNKNELVFYQIFDKNGNLVQNRLPENLTQFDTAENREEAWLAYMNTITQSDLFNLNFSRTGENIFEFSCQINASGDKFLNRFENDIYGEYTVHLYCSELENGVTYSFKILLDEAEINYVSVNNYSNFNDISVADEVVVPSQRGILEISLDPVEAVFDEFSITNNAANYLEGAGEATFTFAYEKINADASKEYVLAQTFGRYTNGTFSFTYQEMIDLFNSLNESFEDNGENSSVSYTGKIYISYYMPSNNVDDGVDVGFDVSVTYGNEGQNSMPSTIMLKTKLGSYAKLTFAEKEDLGGVYYVARGLSYNLNLDYYGFSEDQISITSTNDFIANVSKVNGQYVLNVTSESINYNNDIGYKIEINTVATKTVDNVTITTTDTLTIYVMEYVLNYVYVDGVYEDIVKGMENGVISTAIGNPYTLEFAIKEFMEYDSSNAVVNREVEDFVTEMTQNIKWTVYLNGEATELATGKTIRTDYYSINSFVVTPLRIYESESDIYHFSASANYTMRNGLYAYSAISTNANPIYTVFSFDVHQQSTEDSPIPIETYEEFLDMQDGEWYILLNDITLPGSEYASANGIEQFSPITANIAGLDGNGYYLRMAGTYSYDTLADFGVFSSISEDSILQNVTIMLSSDVVIRMNVSTFNVGLLAATNNGIITNCHIGSATGNEGLSVVCATTAQTSYVAGLVANNIGYITNSRSKINIFANVNLAGFVGQNSGIIASSYYLGASLKNETNTTSEFTAGFAVSNSGEIHTSYVSGQATSNLMFYYGEDNSIQSSYNISGFVYTNSGSVEDCYSNITLRQSGAFASGFVYENSGNVERCFSTSVLESEQTSNYGFARYNDDESGIIKDCYYLSESEASVGGQTVDINVSIGEITLNENTDITPLTTAEFGEGGLENFFSSYVVADGREISSVWFFNDDAGNLTNFNGSVFNTGRLELVAPNIVAFSQRELERIETIVDDVTGATSAKYIYTYTANSNPLGSVYNPILISSADNMENYILQENNAANYNYSYYRIISDIDYSEYLYNSNLYKTKFMGYLEGNFMTVSGMSLVSSEAMTSAGMFAELGSSTILDAVGTIMNFNFNPQAVSFANTDVVGAVVGKVDGGNIYNVNLTRSTSEQIVVVGKNIVGGAVGLAIGRYDIQNLYSEYSAKARYQSSSNDFDSGLVEYSTYSFAGSLIGVASGTGSVYNSEIRNTVSVLGDKAGLVFGLIDENVNVSKILVEMQSGMLVNAYSYGGLVVGESKGTVDDVTVAGMVESFTNFMKTPIMPTALGGYAGLVSGGNISNIEMTQSITISNESASAGVEYLGGIAGIVTGATEFDNITVNANLIGFTYVGGVVGYVNAPSNTIYFTDVNVNTKLTVYGHRLSEVGIGGLAGYVGSSSIINLTSSLDESASEGGEPVYKTNNFIVSANATVYLYGTDIEIFVGGIVGANKSSISHSVSNCYISLTGENKALDMSQSLENLRMSAKVAADENKVPKLIIDTKENDSGESLQTIYATTLSSNNTKYYCDISFETTDPTLKFGSYLRLNIYGDPTLTSSSI